MEKDINDVRLLGTIAFNRTISDILIGLKHRGNDLININKIKKEHAMQITKSINNIIDEYNKLAMIYVEDVSGKKFVFEKTYKGLENAFNNIKVEKGKIEKIKNQTICLEHEILQDLNEICILVNHTLIYFELMKFVIKNKKYIEDNIKS